MSRIPFAFWRRSAPPTTIEELFGASLAHIWDSYDDATGVFTDRIGGFDVDDAGDNPPAEAVVNGHHYPVFDGGAASHGLETSADFTTLDDLTSWTVFGAFKTNDGEAYGGLVEKPSGFYIELDFGPPGTISGALGASAGSDWYGTIPVDDDQWHRFVITYKNGTLKQYVDGVLDVAVTTASAVPSGVTNPFFIGKQFSTAADAGISLIGIATRAATAAEVPLLDGFIEVEYTAAGAAPTVASTSPSLGDTAGGGQLVTLTGTGFTGATGVTFDGVAATSLTVVNDTTITCIPPAGSAGPADVAVTTSGGTGTGSGIYEYWSPTQITGVDLYFDANKGVSLSGSDIVTWTDQKNSVVATAAGASIPTQVASVFGALPSVRFAKEGRCGFTKRTYATGFSVFAITKHTATDQVVGSAYSVPLTILGDGVDAYCHFGYAKGQIAYTSYAPFDAPYLNMHLRHEGLNDGAARMIGVTHNHSTDIVTMYVGETQWGMQGKNDFDTTYAGFSYLGNGYSNVDGFAGDMGAVIVVSGIISGADLTKLDTWARQRFGTPASPAAYQPQTNASPLPKVCVVEPNYNGTTFTNSGSLGSAADCTAQGGTPTAVMFGGAPNFEFTTDWPLGHATSALSAWSQSGAKTFAGIIDVEAVTVDPAGTFPAGSYTGHGIIGDAAAYTGLGVVKDGASYYAFMYDYDSNEHYATYDITSMLTAALGGAAPGGANAARLRVMGWKDASNKLWIRVVCNGVDSGDVTQNATCGATGVTTNALRVGGPTTADGMLRHAASWQGDIGSTERDKWFAWSA